jgi:hypothetical protein
VLGWLKPKQEDRLDADRRRLGASLLRLEINTIIQENMTAERMPVLPHALLDIFEDYAALIMDAALSEDELRAILFLPNPPPAAATPPSAGAAAAAARKEPRQPILTGWPGPRPPGGDTADTMPAVEAWIDQARKAMGACIFPDLDSFSRLRRATARAERKLRDAAIALGDADRPLAAQLARDRTLLVRARNNIETLLRVMRQIGDQRLIDDVQLTRAELKSTPDNKPRQLGPYEVPPSDYLAIRKVWEIGTDEIVAQTVIALDGDVVTRLVPLLAQPEGRGMLDVHQLAVNTSVAYWRGMVETLLTFVERAIGSFFRRPP